AATPVVDGKSVFALYASGEIVAFDAVTGRIRWERLLAFTRDNHYGIASSPILADGLLIVLLDSDKNRLIALEPETGRDRWRREREDKTWATPLLVRRPEGAQVVIAGSPTVGGWSLAKGERLWHVDLLSGDAASSPIYAGERIIVCGEGRGVFALDAQSRGDGANRLVWKAETLEKGYIAAVISPVSDGERVWLHCSQALVCFDLKTGKILYEQELPENSLYASPVLAGNRVYVFGEKTTFVVAAAAEYRLLSTCRLKEIFHTCPAFAPGRIWIRSEKSLYCLGKAKAP
ncbi:MAG: PQQ-like beta-propeller repeat protein, partial [Planctomycetota bacterium]|nr:PQQ-like beta-propeller repeat protein [Planctomycetota bacterium]